MQCFFLFILCIVFCVNSVQLYECNKRESTEELNYYLEKRQLKVIKIICTNVTQQTVFNHCYENEIYPQELYIEHDSNKIPILHPYSSISKFAGIRKLSLKDIGLKIICPGVFNCFQTLEELNLSDNQIENISNKTFNYLENLKLLDLSNNFLRVIEEGSFLNLHHLHTLNIKFNFLPKIYNCEFINLKNLKQLDLSQNSIETIEENSFLGLFHLEMLNIYNNKISELNENLFRDLTALTSLDIANNKITGLPNSIFINLTNLNHLDISGNYLKVVDFANFPKIRSLFLSFNYISSVENWKTLNVENLTMINNDLTEFEIPENVVELNLPFNLIRNIINKFSDESKPIIEKLNLESNEISDIDSDSFKKMVNLNTLRLNGNKITVIRENTFQDCNLLRELNLSKNKIGSIEPNAFKGLSPRATINISGNNLKILKSDIFSDNTVKIALHLDRQVDHSDLQILVNSSKIEIILPKKKHKYSYG